MMQRTQSEIRILSSRDGITDIQVKLEDEAVWLNQYQQEELFETKRTSIIKHLPNRRIGEGSNLCNLCTSSKRRYP
jgi:hypothetical protein